MSTYTISNGQTVSGFVVSNGNFEIVSGGGSSVDSIINSGGTDDVYGSSISAFVSSGGTQIAEPGGTISGATVYGFQGVDGGAVYNTTLESGSTLYDQNGVASSVVMSGGSIYDYANLVSATVYGGVEVVFSGGKESSTTLLSGGSEAVESGGSATSDVISSGGLEQVVSGGTTLGAALSGGTLNNSGTASGTHIYAGGKDVVYSGGVETNASVYSGGAQTVQSGAVVSGVTVYSGGVEQVSGTVSNITVSSGGTLSLASGGQISGGMVASGATVTGLTLNSGSLSYGSGGSVTVDGITVQSGATIGLTVGSGASISGFTISGDTFSIGSGSVASGLTVNSGGIENVSGTASQTTINNGGIENVYSGGVESGATINSGGALYVSGGSLSGGTVTSGGTLTVSTGGVDNGTIISSGGNLIISSGGIVSAASLQSGANLTLQSGGEFIGTLVESGSGVGGLIVTSGLLTATSGGFQLTGTVKGGAANTLEIGSGAQVSGLTDTGLTYKIDLGGVASGIVVGSGGIENIYGTDNGATVNSGGVENVYSGGVESGATINSGGAINVSGGVVRATTVESGATLTVFSGGVDSGGTIASGGTLVISNGGVVSGVTLTSGSHLSLLSGGELIGSAVVSGGGYPGGLDLISGSITAVSGGFAINGTVLGGTANVLEIGSGALVSGLTDSGLTYKIDAGGIASSVILASGAIENVSGTANLTTINSGGVQNIYSGGVDSGSTVNAGGKEYVSGGTVNAATVESGATLTVLSGGVDNGSTILSGGTLVVSNGAVVSGVNVESGATLTLVSGGSVNGIIVETGSSVGGLDLSSGSITATTGGFTINGTVVGSTANVLEVGSGALVSGLTDSSLTYKIDLGGVASGVVLSGSGIETVYGTANATTVNSGTTETIYSGGVDNGSIINNGGIENVSGGTVNAVNVESGGTLTVFGGGTDNGSFVQNGGSEYVSGGLVSGTSVENGGTLTILNGTVDASIVLSGGVENVSGGVINATNVESGGTLNVYSGAVDSGSILNGGSEFVLSGGTANGVSVESGGWLTVNTSGSANGAVINNGGIVEFNTAVTSSVSVSFGSGAGDLYLDAPKTFAGNILGFTASDSIDLTTIPTATSVSWTNNVLTIGTRSGTIKLALDGSYASDTFSTSSDGYGGTLINMTAPSSPAITASSYNAVTGILTLTGSNLTTTAGNYIVTDFTLTGKGDSTYTLTSGSAISGTPTSTSVSIQLSTADQTAIDALLNKAGTLASDGSTYNLAATAGWDTGASAVTTEAVTVTLAPVVSSVAYNEATGQITLGGGNFTTASGDYTVTDFTFKGENGDTYTLTSGSVVTGTPGSSSATIQLSAADQLAVDGLFNKSGNSAVDGTLYNLSAPAGWDTPAGIAITSEAFTVSNVSVPAISAVSYDAATGVFTVTGSNFSNLGSSNGVALADFTFSSGGNSYTFSASNDRVSNLTATGFNVTLSAADKATVDNFVNANGGSSFTGNAYNLSASANWDSGVGSAISTQAVTANSVVTPAVTAVAYNAATGILTLSGSNLTTSAANYSLTDFSLKGDGGASYTLTSGSSISGTPTSTGLSIQLSTADQLAIDGLLNKDGAAANSGATYNLSATAGWDTFAPAITTAGVTVSNVTAPTISNVSYNAVTGVFTVTGSNLDNAGSSNGIALPHFMIAGDNGGAYTFSASNDTVSNLTASGFTITLNSTDLTAVNAILDGNGSHALGGSAYNLTASANWDSDSGSAITSKAVTVSGYTPVLAETAYNAATGVLTLTGSNLTTASGDYTVTDLTLKGDGGVAYTLTSGSSVVSGTPSATGVSIQLSTADQLAIDGLLNQDGASANSGAIYNLSATAGWDTAAKAVSTEPVTVSNADAPNISNVSYDAATGVFTVSGSDFSNHGASNGIALADLALSAGSSSYAFNANDTVSNLSSTEFTITLSTADKTTVNSFVDANGGSTLGGSNYGFGGIGGWDSNSGSTFTSSAVSVNGVPPTLTGVAYNAATGILTLSGHNLTTTSAGYNVSDLTLSGDGGASYSLTSGSSVSGTPTSSSVSLLLSAADQVAIDGLLNKDGAAANDGATYHLAATAGWDTAGAAISTEAVTVSNVTVPTLSAVSYNATTGVLSFTGANLSNHGGSNGIAISDFKMTAGMLGKSAGGSLTLSASNDTVSNLTASGFNLQLGIADKEALDLFVNANGLKPSKGAAYNLSVAANWDSDSGSAAITTKAVTVSNVQPNLDTASYNYTTGKLTVTGNYLTTSGYKVADLTITGDNDKSYTLSKGSVVTGKTGGSLTIHLSAADQLAVDGLLNQAGAAANSGATYNLSGLAGWDTGASAFTTQGISVSNVITPAITKVAYNAATGVLTFTGTHLVNAGTANGINSADLTLSSNLGSLTLSSSDTLGKLTSTGFSVTLSSADKAALLNVFNENGTVSSNGTAYKLAALAGWDSDNGIAINSQAVTVSHGAPILDSVKYDAASGVLTLTGEYLTTKASGYAIGNFTLLGDGGVKYALTSGSHVAAGTATATSVSIDLSAKDQLAIDGLLNNNGTQSNDAHTYNLSATAGWDTGAAVVKTEAVTVSNVTAPSISSVAYNAKTGVFTVSGVDVTNHGSSSGITLKDLSVTGGTASGSYTFGSKDVVSHVSATGFTVTLSAADKTLVNHFVTTNSTAPSSTYEFNTSSNWDSDSGASSHSALTVTGLTTTTTTSSVSAADISSGAGLVMGGAGTTAFTIGSLSAVTVVSEPVLAATITPVSVSTSAGVELTATDLVSVVGVHDNLGVITIA